MAKKPMNFNTYSQGFTLQAINETDKSIFDGIAQSLQPLTNAMSKREMLELLIKKCLDNDVSFTVTVNG